jgi:hypothetical protein
MRRRRVAAGVTSAPGKERATVSATTKTSLIRLGALIIERGRGGGLIRIG